MSKSESATIVLFGLDKTLSSELHSVLAHPRRTIHVKPFLTPAECMAVVDQVGADLVFCSSDRARYIALLEVVGRHKAHLPVVVVSRTPEVSEWLDAIEAGASDYCSAPFEASHIQWILDSVLKQPSSETLRRASG